MKLMFRKKRRKDFLQENRIFLILQLKRVLQQMPFPEKCKPYKGFFPESAKGVDDQFVFVSLDADLYDPLYAGLQFFYPKLVQGGYIFVHDFNNDNYKGARKAVEAFCREQGINFFSAA